VELPTWCVLSPSGAGDRLLCEPMCPCVELTVTHYREGTKRYQHHDLWGGEEAERILEWLVPFLSFVEGSVSPIGADGLAEHDLGEEVISIGHLDLFRSRRSDGTDIRSISWRWKAKRDPGSHGWMFPRWKVWAERR
jgi:hypothetical protein